MILSEKRITSWCITFLALAIKSPYEHNKDTYFIIMVGIVFDLKRYQKDIQKANHTHGHPLCTYTYKSVALYMTHC